MPLMEFIKREFGDADMRAFVDSAPMMEKAWAQRAGIGWVGKNANIIRQQQGSFFFLCEIITDLELEPDAPAMDHCGTCRRCIEACPTDAITHGHGFETASYNTSTLIMRKEQMLTQISPAARPAKPLGEGAGAH